MIGTFEGSVGAEFERSAVVFCGWTLLDILDLVSKMVENIL